MRMFDFLRMMWNNGAPLPQDCPMDAEFQPYRDELRLAGLSEKKLRKMDPDDRVKALEQAHLDPYDYIYLAC